MQVIATELDGVFIIEPRVFEDARGFFMETYHKARLAEAGIDVEFVQDNHSRSRYGTLRGLHYQVQHPQAKLIRTLRGEIYDVAVDIRNHSPSFGRWVGVTLSETNRRQLYVPAGFAHGFCTLSEDAEIVYKCSDFYYPQYDRTILWNDPAIGIDWPIAEPLLSDKDRRGMPLGEAEVVH